MKTTINETWIHGKYIVSNHNVEINTSLPYVSIEGARIQFFAQGEQAQEIINAIRQHWSKQNCSIEDSILVFMDEIYY